MMGMREGSSASSVLLAARGDRVEWTIDECLSHGRARPWLPLAATWQAFCTSMLPGFACCGALFILSPVYFTPLMEKDFHVTSFKIATATQGMFCAWVLGGVSWSWVADRYGRKVGFLGCAWGSIALTVAATFATSFEAFFVLRTALGLFLGGVGACSYVHVIEWALQAARKALESGLLSSPRLVSPPPPHPRQTPLSTWRVCRSAMRRDSPCWATYLLTYLLTSCLLSAMRRCSPCWATYSSHCLAS